ncbi:MAG: guanylate kinase [Actinomycetes bacterium]
MGHLPALRPLPPKLTVEERRANLELAKRARHERADAKAAISAGRISIFDAINDPRDSIQRMKVIELLEAIPGVGPARAALIMEKRKISLSRRIAGLGPHQLKSLRQEAGIMKLDPQRGSLIVMSGPGGVGKSTITQYLKGDPRFWVSISVTTRAPRSTEKNGVDYFFVTENKFDQMIANDEFLEWAEFAGARYGTPKQAVAEWRDLGKHVLLEIEIAGARQIRASDPSAKLVFIAPPSWEELASRLANRGTDSSERRAARLALAREEMAAAGEFDTTIVNEQVEGVVSQMVSLATALQE